MRQDLAELVARAETYKVEDGPREVIIRLPTLRRETVNEAVWIIEDWPDGHKVEHGPVHSHNAKELWGVVAAELTEAACAIHAIYERKRHRSPTMSEEKPFRFERTNDGQPRIYIGGQLVQCTRITEDISRTGGHTITLTVVASQFEFSDEPERDDGNRS